MLGNNDNVNIPSNYKFVYDWVPMTFLNLVLQSAFIPNTRILSTLLISQAGLGKTIKLDYLRKFDFIEYVLDITPKHIADFLDDVNDDKKRFLVIPDYIATLGHSKRTSALARSIFRAMIDEGVIKISIYGMERDYKRKIKAGLISGITTEYYDAKTRLWKSDGFLQRFLPFSYSHTQLTATTVLDNKRDNIDSISAFDMKIDRYNAIDPKRNSDIDNQIRVITYSLLEPKEAPYRMYDQIVALCKSSAVLRGSNVIEDRDIELIKRVSTFFNKKQIPL